MTVLRVRNVIRGILTHLFSCRYLEKKSRHYLSRDISIHLLQVRVQRNQRKYCCFFMRVFVHGKFLHGFFDRGLKYTCKKGVPFGTFA